MEAPVAVAVLVEQTCFAAVQDIHSALVPVDIVVEETASCLAVQRLLLEVDILAAAFQVVAAAAAVAVSQVVAAASCPVVVDTSFQAAVAAAVLQMDLLEFVADAGEGHDSGQLVAEEESLQSWAAEQEQVFVVEPAQMGPREVAALSEGAAALQDSAQMDPWLAAVMVPAVAAVEVEEHVAELSMVQMDPLVAVLLLAVALELRLAVKMDPSVLLLTAAVDAPGRP